MTSVKQLSPDEVVQRGWELYDHLIRPRVEPEHDGRFLVIDVESGRHVLADEELAGFDLAREEMAGGVFHLVRVGRRAAHRIRRRTTA